MEAADTDDDAADDAVDEEEEDDESVASKTDRSPDLQPNEAGHAVKTVAAAVLLTGGVLVILGSFSLGSMFTGALRAGVARTPARVRAIWDRPRLGDRDGVPGGGRARSHATSLDRLSSAGPRRRAQRPPRTRPRLPSPSAARSRALFIAGDVLCIAIARRSTAAADGCKAAIDAALARARGDRGNDRDRLVATRRAGAVRNRARR